MTSISLSLFHTDKANCSSFLEIINSNHIDILEMDAASKTGIDDIRELIDDTDIPSPYEWKNDIVM